MNFKDIEKKFGDIFSSGKSIVDQERMIIPVSPRLDIALGGGILEGSFFILTGREKAGKTSLALSFAANCQKEEYGGRDIYLANIEGRLRKRDLEGIQGLDLDKLHIYGSSEGNILTASKYLQITEELINTHPKSVIIIDSFSAMVTDAEYNSGMDEMQRADAPKIIAKFCRKVSNVIPVNNNIIVGITHLMANCTGYGKKFIEKSGMALQYQADTKLLAYAYKRIFDKAGRPIQQETEWSVETSAIGAPGQKVQTVLTFGVGIDKPLEITRLAVDLGIIQKKGAWYVMPDGEKIQGEEKVIKYVNKNNLYDELNKKVKDIYS